MREALRDLELLGLVESTPYRGSRVRVFDDAALAEIQPVRAVLEELAAQLACPRLAGDVSALEEEVESMREAAAAGDLGSLTRHDIAFHRRLVEAAGNAVLRQTWESLGVDGWITLTVYEVHVPPADAAEQHVALLEALRSGDAALAGREARAHIESLTRAAGPPVGRRRQARP